MVQKLARGELSVKARLGYVALLLVSSAMTAGLVSLWLTEAFLPLRTHLAFGAMASSASRGPRSRSGRSPRGECCSREIA